MHAIAATGTVALLLQLFNKDIVLETNFDNAAYELICWAVTDNNST